eukprot:354100-Chlamydomonas_euryale.AAC.4
MGKCKPSHMPGSPLSHRDSQLYVCSSTSQQTAQETAFCLGCSLVACCISHTTSSTVTTAFFKVLAALPTLSTKTNPTPQQLYTHNSLLACSDARRRHAYDMGTHLFASSHKSVSVIKFDRGDVA